MTRIPIRDIYGLRAELDATSSAVDSIASAGPGGGTEDSAARSMATSVATVDSASTSIATSQNTSQSALISSALSTAQAAGGLTHPQVLARGLGA